MTDIFDPHNPANYGRLKRMAPQIKLGMNSGTLDRAAPVAYSQENVGKAARKAAKQNPDWEIAVRPHPSQDGRLAIQGTKGTMSCWVKPYAGDRARLHVGEPLADASEKEVKKRSEF